MCFECVADRENRENQSREKRGNMTIFNRLRGLQDAVDDSEVASPNGERMTGKITKLDLGDKGGWGFISSKQKKFTRIFFHWSALTQDTLNFVELKKGMEVEFTPVEVPEKGWRAIRVRVIEQEETVEEGK